MSDIRHLICWMGDIQKRLGKNVARLRKERGESQEAFADHAGIHRTYISDIERGARNPTIEVVAKIAKALGVRPGELLD
nr:helix-turn-helix transcriptional regulator [Aurantiacibacter sp. 219JJ12-13]MDP5263020.1 helix-turn-helix transcriptional regulator [Aurantiacibacter sp. 219JJ12-13]